jgi:hypothetical protein
MSYWTVSEMALDNDLTRREAACYAQEPAAAGDAQSWALENGLALAASPGWDAAWASALAAGNPAPGRDEAVITDGMILSAVQALIGGAA